MKHNQFSKRIQSRRSPTRPYRAGLATILATFLALLVFSIPESLAKKAVSEKVKEPDKKGQIELKSTTAAPKKNQAAVQFQPIELEKDQVEPAPAATEKGKQLKWQVVSSGSDCGTSSITYRLGIQEGCALCGTVGQLATGQGSSPSYGVNSGFWQEGLGGYLRGDANTDGKINIADAVYLVNYLFIGGPAPDPFWVGDANGDDLLNIADVVYLVNYLFVGGPQPRR